MGAGDSPKEEHPEKTQQKSSPKRSPTRSPPSHPPDADAPILIPGEDEMAAAPALLEPDDSESDRDHVFDDADSAFDSTHSSTTSISEAMIEQVKEHGRQYKGYLGAKYVLPMDEQEMERLDLQCHLVWLTLDKRLAIAPIKNPRRAMDVGCGTADAYPGTDVVGVDIAPTQPNMTPPNLRFELDDLEREWTFTSKFDYIHSQLMIGAFQDWPNFFKQSFENLEEGGYLEVADIDFVIKCDDDTLEKESALNVWHEKMHEGATLAGFPLDAISKVPDMMRDAGFADVVAIPFPWPINTWPRDPKHKEVGRWAMENFTMGCESMSQALFTRALGWSIDELRVFMTQVRQDLKNRRIHAYWNFWVVYGRKPGHGSG
ncbi:unnamed protein product [Clonostachys rosea f. rosea IK726]|uniref:Uncharacterized protein n=1 Tax=Clonostachys rosea f. rosea IK726 TaxID=1349383 RepID=A0ACA9UTL8_BIOOC|nr:unnamed protein product [Clonostachys rosea f. rosea IK726]